MATKKEKIQKNNKETLGQSIKYGSPSGHSINKYGSPLGQSFFLKDRKYFEAIGRRKTASSRVRLYVIEMKNDKGAIFINERNYKDYLPDLELQKIVEAPLKILNLKDNNFFVSLKVRGGGLRAQAEASRLALARALVKFDEKLKPKLKNKGFLKRDPRAVERKKWGLRKARRAPQWQKR